MTTRTEYHVDPHLDVVGEGKHFLPTAGGYALAVMRIAFGFYFLWAFVDKLFGLGFATPAERAVVNGGSPTTGYLSGVEGPLAGFYNGMAGSTFIDILFMAGLLGIGLTLVLGAGARLGAGLDWKTSLQELSAEHALGVPEYVIEDEGPDHEKTFTAQVQVGDELYGHGTGRSKKEAEQGAAEAPGAQHDDVLGHGVFDPRCQLLAQARFAVLIAAVVTTGLHALGDDDLPLVDLVVRRRLLPLEAGPVAHDAGGHDQLRAGRGDREPERELHLLDDRMRLDAPHPFRPVLERGAVFLSGVAPVAVDDEVLVLVRQLGDVGVGDGNGKGFHGVFSGLLERR